MKAGLLVLSHLGINWTIGQRDQVLAKLHQPISQHPEQISQAHEVMADGGLCCVLAWNIFGMIKLLIAQTAVTVPANNG